MSTHNIRLYEDLTKNIFQLSSNKHLISSSDIKRCNVRKPVFWASDSNTNQAVQPQQMAGCLKI